jgi:hypothetical protein
VDEQGAARAGGVLHHSSDCNSSCPPMGEAEWLASITQWQPWRRDDIRASVASYLKRSTAVASQLPVGQNG